MSDLSALAKIVKETDYDRFLTTLFAGPDKREDLYALYAFNQEIAKTREVVSETTLGLIRLTWWREALDEIYEGKNPRKHEVVEPLAETIKKYNLPKQDFETLIYAREFDLEDVLPADLNGLVKYTEFTNAPLLNHVSRILKGTCDEDNLKQAAIVIGFSRLLKSAPYHLRDRRCYFPESLLEEAGLDPYIIYDGKGRDALKAVTADIVWRAQEAAAAYQPHKDLRPINMHFALSLQQLKQLRACDFDIFHPKFQSPPPFSMLRLMMKLFARDY